MLPAFARPKHGRRSVFDKEAVKFGVGPVLMGFVTFLVVGGGRSIFFIFIFCLLGSFRIR